MEDPFKPVFKLEEKVDPSTGLSMVYEVIIPQELEKIMAYDAPLIRTMTTTKIDTGVRPGVYDITIMSECNNKKLVLKKPVALTNSLQDDVTPMPCDIDFSGKLTYLKEWIC